MRSCQICQSPLSGAQEKFCSPTCRNSHHYKLRRERGVTDGRHGTTSSYVKGCRCELCRAANAAYSAVVRARRPKQMRKPRSDKGVKRKSDGPKEHGTFSAYKHPCRCDLCRAAAAKYNAEWRAKNVDKNRRYFRDYAKRNADRVKSYGDGRRAAPFDSEAMAYCAIIEHDPCVYCGKPAETVDHIDAVSISANSDWSNLAPACRSCNSRKAAKRLLPFLAYQQLRSA